jgi:hypothetical protein
MAAGHTLDTHQADALAVALEPAVLHLEAAHAEHLRHAVQDSRILRCRSQLRTVKMGVIEVPKPGFPPQANDRLPSELAVCSRRPQPAIKLDNPAGILFNDANVVAGYCCPAR